MTALPSRPLLRLDEVAEYLDVTPRTVRRWISKGHLKAEKLSRCIRVTRQSVLKFRQKSRMRAPT